MELIVFSRERDVQSIQFKVFFRRFLGKACSQVSQTKHILFSLSGENGKEHAKNIERRNKIRISLLRIFSSLSFSAILSSIIRANV